MADLNKPESPQVPESVDAKTEAFVESQKRSLFLKTGDKIADYWPEILSTAVTFGGAAMASQFAAGIIGTGSTQFPHLDQLIIPIGTAGAVTFMAGWSRGEITERERAKKAKGNQTE